MLRIKLLLLAIASLIYLLASCATFQRHPTLVADRVELPPLVPVRNYVADIDVNSGHQISPDGTKLLWFTQVGLGRGVSVRDLATNKVRSFRLRTGGAWWAENSRHVLIAKDSGGDENPHIFRLDTLARRARPVDITPWKGSASRVLKQIKNSADLVIENNRRKKTVFDVYYFSASTGEITMLAENPGDVSSWFANDLGKIIGRTRRDKQKWIFERNIGTSGLAWQQVLSCNNSERVSLLKIAEDGNSAWALSNRGRDKLALVNLDIATGKESVIFQDSRVDISAVVISHKTNKPLFAVLNPGLQELYFFNKDFKSAIDKMKGVGALDFGLNSISRDEKVITATIADVHGSRTIMYDLEKQQETVLSESSLNRINAISELPEQKPITFTSRDGLQINGYLTLPRGTSAKKLPTVLYVHGGPWLRDFWRQELTPLFLANRGYAVLQVNYRGSSGYGKKFTDAAIGEWAGKMHADLVDGVDWLVAQGIADEKKVAIMGASYGGYATLVGMTMTPQKFACGVDFVGLSDLSAFLSEIPPYWELDRVFIERHIGSASNAEGLAKLKQKSPLFHADKVQAPLLIMHGVNDPRVLYSQSTRMVDALNKTGKDVRFVTFKGDGHNNQNWFNNLTMFREVEDFLAKYLGGRSNGFDIYELVSWMF